METKGESAFTPGPWTARANAYGCWFVYGDGINLICGGNSHDTLTEHNAYMAAAAPELYEALRSVNRLISEAALTGFNWADGDWAQRLFESQQVTSRALSKAVPAGSPQAQR